MTTPGRLLDFFTLEASEYLTRLESLVTQQAMPAPDATHLAAAARGLRGSATMAKASELARLATSVERIAAGVVQGVTKWEPEVQRSMVGAIEDLKLLVRSVRTWGAEQDARVEESLHRLARYGPTREVRNDDVILPISQLFHNDDGPHVVYVAPNPKTHYEQQLRETGHIGPGKLSPEVKRMPTPAEARAASQAKTPPRGKELSDVLNSSLATMRSLENRNSGPQPQAAELVPIQELLYKGQRAIERA
ncbi:MAG: Hpt domain protein, partial [Gemmatimonadales bacterium]|nr:Hpt domain protein [Gemmatimonadales bacterium]